MGVPFPSPEEASSERPSYEEAHLIARGFLTAAAPESGPTRLQQLVCKALVEALTDHPLDPAALLPISAEELAEGMARRTQEFRLRTVEMMILLELLLRPLPPDVADRVEVFADALSVGDDCRHLMRATQHASRGALGLAASDFQRNGYECMVFERLADGQEHTPAEAWLAAPHDPELAARWQALEHCPAGSLGRGVWEFYRARGFVFPGLPGSAPPLLAQHDWVHVLGDYGSTVESELEVFGLIYRANDDPRAFSLLVSVLSLFEAGYLQTGMGLFEMDLGHVSAADEVMALRLGDAVSRGAWSGWRWNDAHDGSTHGVDYLDVDWFSLADLPLDEARAHFYVPEKSTAALAAGSVGPWEPGGISPYQWECGLRLAEAEGRPYEPYGASPGVDASELTEQAGQPDVG
jgi:hypothetical protein